MFVQNPENLANIIRMACKEIGNREHFPDPGFDVPSPCYLPLFPLIAPPSPLKNLTALVNLPNATIKERLVSLIEVKRS